MSLVAIASHTRRQKHSRYRLGVLGAGCYDNLDNSSLYYPYLGFDLQTDFPATSTSLTEGWYDTLLVDGVLWTTWASREFDNNPFAVQHTALGPWVAMWDGANFVLVGDQLEPTFTWDDPDTAENFPAYTPSIRRSPQLCTDGTDVFCVYELVMVVTDPTSMMQGDNPIILYRCRRWTGATWELYGEISTVDNDSFYGLPINIDFAYLNTNGSQCNTMPNQCVADAGNVYVVWSERVRLGGINGFSSGARMRFATFDGTAPPVPGDGGGGSVEDIDISDKVIVFRHGAVPQDRDPWYATMLNSTGAVVFYVQYDVADLTSEEQIRVWSDAGGALGTIPTTDFDNSTSQDIAAGPVLSTTTFVDSSVEMMYLGAEIATGTPGNAPAYVVAVEVESPLVTHHLDLAPFFDNTRSTYRLYGLIAEGNNIWAPGITGSGESFQQYTDHQCMMPFWTGAGGGSSISVIPQFTHRGQVFDESLWFGEWTSFGLGAGAHNYFTLREFPIHRCKFDCPTCASILSQFFETGEVYDPPGPEDWDASSTWSGYVPDSIDFYIDNVLVTHAVTPDASGNFYYGDTAPGTIDLSTLSNGLHDMTVVANFDTYSISCTNTATIRVGPVPPPAEWKHAHYLVDGHEIADVDISADNLQELGGILVGSFAVGALNDWLIDDVKVGSSSGASDIFSANFSSTIVPPFTSTTNPGDLSIVSGQLQVSGTADAYAEKDATWDADTYPEIYIECKVTIDASVFTAGGFTGDFVDLLDSGLSQYTGLFIDTDTPGGGTGEWVINGAGTADGTTATDGVQYTLVIHLSQT